MGLVWCAAGNYEQSLSHAWLTIEVRTTLSVALDLRCWCEGGDRMSKGSNVHPGHYKVAGRGRQGEGLLQEEQKRAYIDQRESTRRAGNEEQAGIPTWEATPPNPVVENESADAKAAPRKRVKTMRKSTRVTARRKSAPKRQTAAKRRTATKPKMAAKRKTAAKRTPTPRRLAS